MTKRPRAFVTLSPEAMQAVAEIQRESRVPVSRGQVLQLLIRYGVEHYHKSSPRPARRALAKAS
jgi:hypothetical protein